MSTVPWWLGGGAVCLYDILLCHSLVHASYSYRSILNYQLRCIHWHVLLQHIPQHMWYLTVTLDQKRPRLMCFVEEQIKRAKQVGVRTRGLYHLSEIHLAIGILAVTPQVWKCPLQPSHQPKRYCKSVTKSPIYQLSGKFLRQFFVSESLLTRYLNTHLFTELHLDSIFKYGDDNTLPVEVGMTTETFNALFMTD